MFFVVDELETIYYRLHMNKNELERNAEKLKEKFGSHSMVAQMLGWTREHYALVRRTGKVTPQAAALIKMLVAN